MHISLSPSKLLLGVALICGLLTEYVFFESFFQGDPPNGFGLFFTQCIIVLGMACAGAITKKQPTRTWYASAGFALLGSIATFVTSSEAGLTLAGGGIALANMGLFISFVNKHKIPEGVFPWITWTIIHPAEKLVQGIARICEHLNAFWKRRSSKQKATIIGIPLALITILLLATVNPILEKIIEKIGEILPEFFFAHLFLSAITSGLFFLLFVAASLSESPHETHHTKPSHISWNVVLLFINIPLVIFVILQLATYFMEISGNMTFSYSYSEYATKGVTQAIIATLLCGGFALIAWARTEKKENLIPSSVVLALSLIVLALVSESRVFAYIQEFGFTPTRIVGLTGIGALFVGIMIGGTLLIKQKDVAKTLASIVTIFMIFLTVTPLIQLDKKSITLNIARATTEEPLDTDAIIDLSLEAYPTLLNVVTAEGVPMEGMMLDCASSRGNYTKFLKKINSFIDERSKSRWINETAPDMNMENYLRTHDAPEKCN